MKTRCCLLLLGAVLTSPGLVADEPKPPQKPIKSADFPKVARRIPAFELRINSTKIDDREQVLSDVAAGWREPDDENVRFLKHIAKHDPDPRVRGAAIRRLYHEWVPLDASELPDVFSGYYREAILDRRQKDLAGRLVKDLQRGNLDSGYDAYAAGLLRCREAVPALRNLAESDNVFVRYSAGRALIECGDKQSAAPILKTIMHHPVPANATIREVEDPHYQALAARAYMELGAVQKKEGIQRLIQLMQELENWKDINAHGRLETTREMLAQVSGKFFVSHRDAQAWYEKSALSK